MGGRCAEEIVFNEITNGASNDIERATQLAHDMVCNWGMSKELGPINFKKSGLSPFGNNDQAIDFSDQTSRKIDDEVSRLVKDNYKLAIKILKDNRDALDRLAEGLIVWETLDVDQVNKLVKGEDIGIPLVKDEPKPKVKQDDEAVSDDKAGNNALIPILLSPD